MIHKLVGTALAVGLMLTSPVSPLAAPVVYSFTTTQVGAFGAGPYGTVTLNDTGADIDVVVALRADMNFVNTGGPHSIFSFNALGVLAGDVNSILFNGAANSNVTVVAPGENAPFGTGFTLMLDCTVNAGCQNGAPGQMFDPLSFTIQGAEYADFGFMAPGTTAFFAADVICTQSSTLQGCQGATGAIGVTGSSGTTTGSSGGTGTSGGTSSSGTQVPEPSSTALVGLGLLGAAFGLRARRQAKLA